MKLCKYLLLIFSLSIGLAKADSWEYEVIDPDSGNRPTNTYRYLNLHTPTKISVQLSGPIDSPEFAVESLNMYFMGLEKLFAEDFIETEDGGFRTNIKDIWSLRELNVEVKIRESRRYPPGIMNIRLSVSGVVSPSGSMNIFWYESRQLKDVTVMQTVDQVRTTFQGELLHINLKNKINQTAKYLTPDIKVPDDRFVIELVCLGKGKGMRYVSGALPAVYENVEPAKLELEGIDLNGPYDPRHLYISYRDDAGVLREGASISLDSLMGNGMFRQECRAR